MPKRKPQEARRETRHVDDLLPFPDQQAVFTDLAPGDLNKLADGIRDIGMRDPIQILPENDAGLGKNRILDGHQRLAAAKLLGWTEVPVLVRYDLAHASRNKIDEEFAQLNLDRRHMTALQRLRAWLYYFQRKTGIEITKPTESTDEEFLAGAKKYSGAKSDRHLKRLLKILELPVELQRCVDERGLRQTFAERLAKLSLTVQQEIVAQIEAGDDPNVIVQAYFPARAKTVRLDRDVERAMRQLTDVNKMLRARIAELDDFGSFHGIERHRLTIADSQALLTALDAGLQRAQQS